MKHPRASLTDRAFAEAFCRSSQWLKGYPRLNGLIVGADTVPQGWHHLDWKHIDGKTDWVDIPGDPNGPALPIPRMYRSIATLAVDKTQMIELRETYPKGRDALLLRFGGALVVGALHPLRRFKDHPAPIQVTEQDVSLRVSRGENSVLAGVYEPALQQFYPAQARLHNSDDPLQSVSKARLGVPIL